MKLQFVVVETGERWRRALLRMVLDPKSISHNDYGSFHSPSAAATIHHTTISVAEDSGDECHGSEPPGLLRLAPDMTRDQRQPLLPLSKGEGWTGGSNSHSPTIEYYDEPPVTQSLEHRKITEHSGASVVQIDVPVPQRETPRFPKEKWKTFVALVFMVLNFLLTVTSLAIVHDSLPDRTVYLPLPDIVLSYIAPLDWALDVSEILIMVSTNATILMLIFHKHKFIVMRRVFVIMALLYLMRSITMFVTILPHSSTTYYCSPKANVTTALVVTQRVWTLISGLGLSINGKHTYCGDFIFSGHTVVLVMCYLLISEYSPKRLYPLHWLSFVVSTVGIVMVLLAHGHYTVDVIIAYYVTTTLFWTYHTLANNANLKQGGANNYLSRSWWFPLFLYLEKNVDGPVPRQYEWPLPWPRRWVAKHPNRNS